MEAIRALLKQIVDFWNGRDKRFKRNAIIIAGAVLVVVVILSVVLNQVEYATLYSGLDAEDSAAVMAKLDTEKVVYKVEGDKILVPAKDADRLRLSLSGEVSSFNLDILQQGQGLGMSESDKQVYRIAQREVTIKKAIETMDGVKKATVMLTVPKDSSFVITADKQYSTAGIILTLEDGFEIKSENVNAIALFVVKAVPGLKLENISIMDSAMRNLDVTGGSEDDEAATGNKQLALTNEVQDKLRQQVMRLLNPVFGFGRVGAEVNVTLDFDTKTTDSVTFTPVVGENGVVRSIEEFREKIINGSAATSGEPGTTTNTGGATTYPVVNADNGTYDKNTKAINYEINEMKTHLEAAEGTVKSLSVAVVVDNTDLKEDYTSDVTDMVSKAVGVSPEYISVKFMPMAGAKAAETPAGVEDPEVTAQKNQQLRFYIIVGAVVFVVLLAMALVFMGRKPKTAPLPVTAEAPDMIPGMEYATVEEQEAAEELAAIELVKDSSAKEQIGKLIEKNPELVANLLRTWLSEEQE